MANLMRTSNDTELKTEVPPIVDSLDRLEGVFEGLTSTVDAYLRRTSAVVCQVGETKDIDNAPKDEYYGSDLNVRLLRLIDNIKSFDRYVSEKHSRLEI